MSKPLHLAGNFTYHIGLGMVIDIFPVSSAQILKPINNAAMSLTSIQKSINSLSPHQHGPAYEATYKWGTHL
jgi:hypothetical protein